MNSSNDTTEDILQKCHRDIMWWKLMVEFIEIELNFIHKLLNYNALETGHTHVFETLNIFKHPMKTETSALKTLKDIIEGLENKMHAMLEYDDLSCDAVYLNNHESLKVHFQTF